MNDYEKEISFLNRFFVYKKTSTRNAEKITKALLEQLPDEVLFEEQGTMLAREEVKKAEEMVKPKAKKLKDKIRLQESLEEQKPKTKTKTKTKKANPEIVEEKEGKIGNIVEGTNDIKEPQPKKKTRKTKAVDFVIEDEI